VATGCAPSPFDYCDVVTTTTHKTLKGPRGAVIFFRKGVKSVDANGHQTLYDYETRINNAVFPGLQGGPHNSAIGAIAVAMKLVRTPQFKTYQQQIVKNAKTLCDEMQKKGYTISSGGTDNHLFLLDLRTAKLSGAKAEKVFEDVSIGCNKNAVPGDKSALNPSGVRFGTPALTGRGMKEKDMIVVADLIHKALLIAKDAQEKSGPKLVDFKKVLEEDPTFKTKVAQLKDEVEKFAVQFPMPGHDEY